MNPKGKTTKTQRIPLAYFITFHTYGTWLHGDRRESMDRDKYNEVDGPKIPNRPLLEKREAESMRYDPMLLTPAMRKSVLKVIREVCRFRGYRLLAANVRTNHVHVVIAAAVAPEKIMNDIKAYSTRRLREEGLVVSEGKVWVRHGSTRYLWKPVEVSGAVNYVIFGQGDEEPSEHFTYGF